jgi:uncharacterized membrane protein
MSNIFTGCIPALMTPCTPNREPDFDALVKKGHELIEAGMSAVVYCGSMGDWPLLTEAQRQEGVARLVAAGIPTIVGTGAVNSKEAVSHAAHAEKVGAQGLMVIPRVLSRGASPTAQKAHFSAILKAAPSLPAVIYNSPYYGFATRADLFFELRREFPNLIGFKEFGGAADMRYATYSWIMKNLIHKGINSRAAMGVIFGILAVLLLPTLLITATHLFNYPNNIWVALYIPIVPMFLGYLFFSFGLKRIPASQAMTLALVEIPVAALLAVVVVGESLTMNSYLGLVLIFLCVIVLTKK